MPVADPHADFLASDFDPNAFAHRVLELDQQQRQQPQSTADHPDRPDRPDRAESTSSALAKLNYGVQDLGLQLRRLVHDHHPALILHASSLTSLSTDLGEVKRGLADVQQSVSRLDQKLKRPHHQLHLGLTHLERLRAAAALARSANRFVVLARRLTTHLQLIRDSSDHQQDDKTERVTAEAALTLAELGQLRPLLSSPSRCLTREPSFAPAARLAPERTVPPGSKPERRCSR